MYENAQARASENTSPMPVFLNSDKTVICHKNWALIPSSGSVLSMFMVMQLLYLVFISMYLYVSYCILWCICLHHTISVCILFYAQHLEENLFHDT